MGVATQSSVCVFSWLKAAMANETFYNGSLKLAYLWFNDLIMQSPKEDLVYTVFPAMLEQMGTRAEIIEEICEHIHPIQRYVPDYAFLKSDVWSTDPQVSAVTGKSLTEYFRKLYGPDAHPGEVLREVAWTGAGVLDVIGLVGKLSTEYRATMMPTDFEDHVLRAIVAPADPRADFNLFEEIARYRLPRLQDTPWEVIVELRHHQFVENFREALSAMQAELRAGDSGNPRDVFEEIERKSMKELLSLLSPSPFWATAKGIFTNLPLGPGINPLAVLDSVHAINKERKIAKQFGWLYFLYDLDA